MSKSIKTMLIALSILVGASAGYAADKGQHSMDGPGGVDAGLKDNGTGGDLEDRKLIDPGTTGSIMTCETGALDEFGNCIADPDMQQ